MTAETPTRRTRRNPWPNRLLGLFVAACLIGAGVLVWQYRQTAPEPAPVAASTWTAAPEQTVKPGAVVTGDSKVPTVPDVGVEPDVDEAKKLKRPGSVDKPGAGPNVVIKARNIWAPLVAAPTRNGEVLLPRNLYQVGVATEAAGLGDGEGTTLLSGHVSVGMIPGAMYPLSTVHAGDIVTITLADGKVQRWQVVSMAMYTRPGLPANLFSKTGERRLALVTCAGELIRGPHGGLEYEKNLVVTAIPAP